MKSIYKLLILTFCLLLSLSQVQALAVSGLKVRHDIHFEPGYTQENLYYVTNREQPYSSYDIIPYYREGHDLSPYFTITPNRIDDVPDGSSRPFTVKIELPDKIEQPGRSLTWIKIEMDKTQGGFRAYPSVAVSYYVYVLHPTKYITWSFSAPNMNVNETKNFTVTLENLGEPTIQSVYADISIISLQANQTVATFRTNTKTNIKSWDEITLRGEFDSTGHTPGDYKGVAVLNFDGEKETNEANFRVGSKNVKILNFTKSFVSEAINKFDIIIESAWNTKISNIYADLVVYDLETNQELKKFKSLNTDLTPWTKKILEAYFDTTGLENGEYKIVITLKYEGARTVAEGIIRIDENINAVTVEEIPGQFKLDLSAIFTPMNLLILLLIFLIINIILAVGYFKRKPPKPPVKPIDSAVINHIVELKKKYNNDYIKEMMLKKGWSKEKVKRALKEASKKR